MLTRSWAGAVSLTVVVLACGSQTPPPSSSSPATATVKRDEPKPDLSPVAAPASLVVRSVWKNPARSLDQAEEWGGIPLSWRGALQREIPDFASLWQENAPVYFAATFQGDVVDARGSYAVSLPIRSFDAAREALEAKYETTAVAPGVIEVRDMDDMNCRLAHVPPPAAAPAALVCSDAVEHLAELQPYLTRGIVHEPLPQSDLSVVVDFEPLRRSFAGGIAQGARLFVPTIMQELRTGDAALDESLSELLFMGAEEFEGIASDVQDLRMDYSVLTDQQTATLAFSLGLRSQRSLLAKVVDEWAKTAAPAPAAFWTLPKGVLAATYQTGSSDAVYRPLIDRVFAVADRALLKFEKSKSSGLSNPALPMGNKEVWVPAVRRAVTALGALHWAPASMRWEGAVPSKAGEPAQVAGLRSVLGWNVVAVEQQTPRSVQDLIRSLDELASARVQKALPPAFSEDLDVPKWNRLPGAGGGPKGTARYRADLQLPSPATDEVADEDEGAKAPKAKGKAADKKAPPKDTAPVFIWLVPIGERWILAYSMDEAILRSKVTEAIAILQGTSSPQPNLGSEPGLAFLKNTRSSTAGFFSLASLASALGDKEPFGASLSAMMSSLPSRGQTPVILSLRGERTDTLRAVMELRVQRATITDAVAAAIALAASSSSD